MRDGAATGCRRWLRTDIFASFAYEIDVFDAATCLLLQTDVEEGTNRQQW